MTMQPAVSEKSDNFWRTIQPLEIFDRNATSGALQFVKKPPLLISCRIFVLFLCKLTFRYVFSLLVVQYIFSWQSLKFSN